MTTVKTSISLPEVKKYLINSGLERVKEMQRRHQILHQQRQIELKKQQIERAQRKAYEMQRRFEESGGLVNVPSNGSLQSGDPPSGRSPLQTRRSMVSVDKEETLLT